MGGLFTRMVWSPSSLKRQAKVLMLGLDAAGKTTIMYKLKLGEITTTIPTIGMNIECLETKKVVLNSWYVFALYNTIQYNNTIQQYNTIQ